MKKTEKEKIRKAQIQTAKEKKKKRVFLLVFISCQFGKWENKKKVKDR